MNKEELAKEIKFVMNAYKINLPAITLFTTGK